MDTMNKGLIHYPGKMEHNSARLHPSQSDSPFKTDALSISGIFHLTFSDCGWLWVTGTEGRSLWIKDTTVIQFDTKLRSPCAMS